GARVVVGQFDEYGPWALVGAEQTASGYEVAWKEAGTDQFQVWYTDNNGNFISSAFGVVSGTAAELKSIESSFQQDLNGDGLIGDIGRALCREREGFGSTQLVQDGSNYFLHPNGGVEGVVGYGGGVVCGDQLEQY